MKKLFLTVTILFGMTIGAFAEWNSYDSGWNLFHLFNFNEEEPEEANAGWFEDTEIFGMKWDDRFESSNSNINYGGGGMFGRGRSMNTGVGSGFRNSIPLFGLPGEHGSGNDAEAPLGGGVIVLTALGSVYLIGKRRFFHSSR